MTRGQKLNSIIDSIAAAAFDLKGMRGTLLGALEDAVEVGLCENGQEVHKERRAAGRLADDVGRYIDGGSNDEEGLRAALTRWVDSGDPECVHQVNREGPKPLYRHVKTGGLYRLLWCNLRLEWAPNSSPCVLYQSEKDAQLWVRPESEFFDGRFIEADEDDSQFVACTKRPEPDPLGEALNSGDGSYKP